MSEYSTTRSSQPHPHPLNDFVNNDNVEMIWEIIVDADLIKSKQNINISNICIRHDFSSLYFTHKRILISENDKHMFYMIDDELFFCKL